jgi:hypothetical protein
LTPEEQKKAQEERERADEVKAARAHREADESYKNRQLELMESGNKQTAAYVQLTRALAFFSLVALIATFYQGCLAKRNTDIAQISANAAKSAAKTASDTLGEMKGESERTFKANQDAMRLDERPWLGVSQLEINHSANGALEQQGSASNSGKTPARKVQAVMGVYTEENLYTPGDKDFTFIDYVVKKVWNNEIKAPDYLADAFSRRDPSYHGILPPQNTFRSQIFAPHLKTLGVIPPGNTPYKLPLPHLVNAGIITTFIFYGEIKYFDSVSIKQHSTQFCYYQHPESLRDSQVIKSYLCDKFNDMD